MIYRLGALLLPWILALLLLSAGAFAADYVGTAQCINCHRSEYQSWQGSHHDMAMRHAAPDSVQGDFNQASIVSNNQTNRFFKKGNEYWVNIAGPDGKLQDYQIKYTFGFSPLQQYMVEFDDGRVQLIPFAWDTRSEAEGGQRWFNLYPSQTQRHQEFFWTNTGQNWNYMCADCHSTNVQKNFDVEANSYNTTFSEINVACEACHGPASGHLDWTKQSDTTDQLLGFERNLAKPVTSWNKKPNQTTRVPGAIKPSQQTLMCAQCHSRHMQISNADPIKSTSFGDRYLLDLISPGLYYADGQIYEEDYVYGSFLQSKMYSKGVVCSNCHDAHSAKLILPREKLCLQCHNSETYQSPEHHHHQADSAGAQCINCHMPETTYMQIDGRRDHGWHIPRPDFANKLGTPDTCLSCHINKNSQWSQQHTQAWNPEGGQDEQAFAPVFAAADQGRQQAGTALSHIAQTAANAPIIRASALERMQHYPGVNTLTAIARGAKSADEHIRIGAIRGAEGIDGAGRWRILAPLLKDKVLAVRTEAAKVLVPLWQALSKSQQAILTPTINDYLAVQNFNGDRGFAHANKARVFVYQGKYDAAEKAYKTSMRIDPYFSNAYINLADLYRHQNKPAQSMATLKEGAVLMPDDGHFPYSIGLAYIRAKEKTKAVAYLYKATQIASSNAQFHYAYGLGLDATRPEQAELALARAYELSANPQHLYALCEMQIRHYSIHVNECIADLRRVAPIAAVQALEQQRNSRPESKEP